MITNARSELLVARRALGTAIVALQRLVDWFYLDGNGLTANIIVSHVMIAKALLSVLDGFMPGSSKDIEVPNVREPREVEPILGTLRCAQDRKGTI